MALRRYKTFLRASEKEYEKYRATKQEENIAQAGEKLWNSFNMLIEHISGKKIRSFKQVQKESQNLDTKHSDRIFTDAFENAYKLHIFFYRGWTEDISEIASLFVKTHALVVEIEKRYG